MGVVDFDVVSDWFVGVDEFYFGFYFGECFFCFLFFYLELFFGVVECLFFVIGVGGVDDV